MHVGVGDGLRTVDVDFAGGKAETAYNSDVYVCV